MRRGILLLFQVVGSHHELLNKLLLIEAVEDVSTAAVLAAILGH